LIPLGSGSTPLTGGYSLFSIALDGPVPSSSDVPEQLLSDFVVLDSLALLLSGVNGMNRSSLVTVMWLHCDVASIVLARFGGGSAAYFIASSV
jgi:hypothetical protein